MPLLFNRPTTSDEAEERPASAEQPLEAFGQGEAPTLIHAEELPSAAAKLAELFPEEAPAENAAAEASPENRSARETVQTAGLERKKAPRRRGILSWMFSPNDLPEATSQSSSSAESNSLDAAKMALTADATAVVDPKAGDAGRPHEAATTEILVPSETMLPAPNAPPNASLQEKSKEPPAFPAPADSALKSAADRNPANSSASTHDETENTKEHPDPVSSLSFSEVATESRSKIAGVEQSDVKQDFKAAPTTESQPASESRRGSYRDWALEDKLASHREWIDSRGELGQRADLSGAEMEAADLISVNLRYGDLHDANLRAADMLLADLRDTCLVRADLEETCLVGANLEGANLEGATLETAMGLVPRQLAGANLRDALLAPQLMEFEAETRFARNSRQAYRYFGAMTSASLLSWLLLWKTKDAQIVTDSTLLPFLHSGAAASALPAAESCLIVPVVIFILYMLFHFHLQRLWESVEELPAIFPDGHALGEGEPGVIVGLLRMHFRWMNPDPTSSRLVERAISVVLAYSIVPVTLLLFWARYLTRQEIHGTILQAVLAAAASGVALYAVTRVGRPPEDWDAERKWKRRLVSKIRAVNPITVAGVLGFLLVLLSAGTIVGVPHDRARAPQYGPANIRRWAADIFWWLGYDPYPDLTETFLSARPANWNSQDNQVPSIDGARLNDMRVRYAQAYGAFLANAHLLHANLQGAFLSQADLRGADMGQSNLRFAVLDQAHMYRANLDRSKLDGADLRRADLREANLSHASLEGAILDDVRLDGASMYTARLDGAALTRANLTKTDLREAILTRTHMDHANLQGAYLWSARLADADLGGAQFGSAILIEAVLRGANLGGAQLAGAVLNHADLSGTSLDGADMRGAFGLTASQLCSARSRRGVLLDDALELQVEAECGGTH